MHSEDRKCKCLQSVGKSNNFRKNWNKLWYVLTAQLFKMGYHTQIHDVPTCLLFLPFCTECRCYWEIVYHMYEHLFRTVWKLITLNWKQTAKCISFCLISWTHEFSISECVSFIKHNHNRLDRPFFFILFHCADRRRMMEALIRSSLIQINLSFAGVTPFILLWAYSIFALVVTYFHTPFFILLTLTIQLCAFCVTKMQNGSKWRKKPTKTHREMDRVLCEMKQRRNNKKK